MTPPQRRRLIFSELALLSIVLGLALRLIPAGLPPFVVQYGGSMLWAVIVYLLLAAAFPCKRSRAIALTACAVATVVELSRLYHTPQSDAFRVTLAGKLLLGRVFNLWHFPIYWITITLAGSIDRQVRASVHSARQEKSRR